MNIPNQNDHYECLLKFVTPYYGNPSYLIIQSDVVFMRKLLSDFSPSIAKKLFEMNGWRTDSVSCVMSGIRGYYEFRTDMIRVLESSHSKSSRQAAFGLAFFADELSSQALIDYIKADRSPTISETAVIALKWIDNLNKSNLFEENFPNLASKIPYTDDFDRDNKNLLHLSLIYCHEFLSNIHTKTAIERFLYGNDD